MYKRWQLFLGLREMFLLFFVGDIVRLRLTRSLLRFIATTLWLTVFLTKQTRLLKNDSLRYNLQVTNTLL